VLSNKGLLKDSLAEVTGQKKPRSDDPRRSGEES